MPDRRHYSLAKLIARERIMAKHEPELAAWRATQVDQPALSDTEYDAAQRANWLDVARAYDPEASLDG